jgi:DUF4097 and DUF4098 domain-containing protein YvlB
MRVSALALAALAVLPLQVGCDLEDIVEGASDRFRADFQLNFNVEPGGRLVLENFNGAVEILGWEKNEVQVTGTKYAAHEDQLKDIQIESKKEGNAVTIRVIHPNYHHGNMGARFSVRVPRQIELERIASSNGHIRVEDVEGNARLETSNSSVTVSRLAGRLDAHTSNGRIDADTVSGDAMLRTSNSAIRASHIGGAVDAQTSNSSIRADVGKPKANVPLRFQTSNGSIELDVSTLDNNQLRATTNNSSITVRLPPSIKAQLHASTSNSSITSDFDVTTHGTLSKNRLEGSINGGGPLIELVTSNGSIRVVKM